MSTTKTMNIRDFLLTSFLVLSSSMTASAKDIKVDKFRIAGPFKLVAPVMVDSVKHDSSKFDSKSLLDSSVNLDILKSATQTVDSVLPKNDSEAYSMLLLQSSFSHINFVKAKVDVKKLKNYKLFIDGKETAAGSDISLLPATHDIVIKCLQAPKSADTCLVNIVTEKPELITVLGVDKQENGMKLLDNKTVVNAKISGHIKPSGDGLYYIQVDYQRFPDNSTEWTYILKETKTHRVALKTKKNISWVSNTPHTFQSYNDTKEGRALIFTDAQTLKETVVCEKMPKDQVALLPNHKKAIVSKVQEGPKADEDKHIYYHPDDRIPGWRSRLSYSLFDLETGVTTPLTFGNRNISLLDISADSRKALFAVSTSDITHMLRTDYQTLLQLDLETMAVDTLIAKDYFMGACKYSPDGKQIAISANAEFANRIGCVLPADKFPNQYEYEMFLLDVSKSLSANSADITPLTKDFNPSISNFAWSKYDGNLYFSADDGECLNVYKLEFAADKKTKGKNYSDYKITKFDLPYPYVSHFYLADNAPFMGVSACDIVDLGKTYWVNTKTMKASMIEDVHQRELADYAKPTVRDFSFKNSEGYDIPGFYILPPGVDEATAAKGSYPMLVYYYGGCSPVSKAFSTSYVFQVLASRGYVVYILEPRGCAGLGQEFGSWHGNTAGDPQTKDIIEGTQAFLKAHPYVNEKKLGCFGASYGGFMTQYLLTKTNMFSCGWSHAGISNHTSYWGYGYWGYTYSQVSMPGSYPWKDKQLYVDHSPLFNADKIKTPLLFTHGLNDRNVPPIESSQLYTALSLLGTPTAYVTFQGEEHHVKNYTRLLNWQHTFMAWFDRWLKDDATWWNELYKEPELR